MASEELCDKSEGLSQLYELSIVESVDLFKAKIPHLPRLLLSTGSNFNDFAILFTFRVLILAILDFNHKTH